MSNFLKKAKHIFMVTDEDEELEEEVSETEAVSEDEKIEIKYRGITSFKQAKEVCDCLRKNYAVVINLQSTSKDVIGRVTDYLSGVLEAIDGEIVAIGINMWICTPRNVVVEGKYAEQVIQEFEEKNQNQNKRFNGNNRPQQDNYSQQELSPFGNKR